MAGACSFSGGRRIGYTMIELKLKRTALRLDFTFVAVLALFFWLDSGGFGLITLTVCAAHEMAHLAVMLMCGIIPESVTFYGAGIRISAPDTECTPPGVQAAVYSAGCLMNFLLAAVMAACGFPEAAAISLFTGCFNMLPIGEFDGRRLLKLFVLSHARPEYVDCILFWSGVLSAVLCGAALILGGRGVSPTLAITWAYIIIMSLRTV